MVIPFAEICHIESLGRDVFVHTMNQKYKIGLRIYQLESMLPPDQFIRISNSVIICRNSIRRIRPALSAKFILTLNNGLVDIPKAIMAQAMEADKGEFPEAQQFATVTAGTIIGFE